MSIAAGERCLYRNDWGGPVFTTCTSYFSFATRNVRSDWKGGCAILPQGRVGISELLEMDGFNLKGTKVALNVPPK